jgi:hypothetical protein
MQATASSATAARPATRSRRAPRGGAPHPPLGQHERVVPVGEVGRPTLEAAVPGGMAQLERSERVHARPVGAAAERDFCNERLPQTRAARVMTVLSQGRVGSPRKAIARCAHA